MIISVKQIEFDTISQVWAKDLWPGRKTIETHSAMNYLGGYDLKNMTTKPTFFGVFVDSELAGVNSGHLCHDKSYRSRGLFVYEKYRKMGLGTLLLEETIKQGFIEGATFIWSYPRNTSWNTYKNAGFILTTDFEKSDFGYNAYCKKY
jgi:GNAT superfamily N-acetyltransferase